MSMELILSDTLLNELNIRKNQLENIIQVIKRRQKNQPEGKVRVVKKSDYYQYYYIDSKGDNVERYISVKEEKFIRKLIQKKYDCDIRRESEYELKLIDNMLKKYNPYKIDNIYKKCSKGRQKFIDPVVCPDDMYINKWKKDLSGFCLLEC
ncbi:MAG: hypothetical protein K6B67_03960 [Lachnospiraceae bacterium]|nr:hypothetical protein [Lachnospiraceae bacterium]